MAERYIDAKGLTTRLLGGMKPGPLRSLLTFGIGGPLLAAESAEQAIRAPRRFMQGEINPYSDEGIGEILNMAGMAGAGTMFAAPKGALGAGPVRPRWNDKWELPDNKARWYSTVDEAAAGLQPKGTAGQYVNTLRNTPGVKPEELEYRQLDMLNPNKNMTAAELGQHLEKHSPPRLVDTWKDKYPDENWVDPDDERFLAEIVDQEYDRLHDVFVEANRREPTQQEGDEMYLRVEQRWLRTRGRGRNYYKYDEYQVPGGDNYRELVIQYEPDKTMKEPWGGTDEPLDVPLYQSAHWNEPNVLAHARMNDRVIEGKPTLFIEEIQSDWHQTGAEQGYRTDPAEMVKARELTKQMNQLASGLEAKMRKDGLSDFQIGGLVNEAKFNGRITKEGLGTPYESVLGEIADIGKAVRPSEQKVADAPYKKDWAALTLKRLVRQAAVEGKTRIAWTSDAIQKERWGDRDFAFYDTVLPKVAAKEFKVKPRKIAYGEPKEAFEPQINELADGRFSVYDRDGNVRGIVLSRAEANEMVKGFPPPKDLQPTIWVMDLPEGLVTKAKTKGMPIFQGGAPVAAPSQNQQMTDEELVDALLKGNVI